MPFSSNDALLIAGILREVAQAEIMPRFRNLADGEVRQKSSALDLVTDVDEKAENVIRNRAHWDKLASDFVASGERRLGYL